jgi:hypothetical protein
MMAKVRRSARVSLGSMVVLLTGSCGGGEPTQPATVAAILVSPPGPTLTSVGASQQLSASASDASGNPVTGVIFTWSSQNSLVATVDGGGLVMAESAGVATINATAQGVIGNTTVTVDPAIDHLAYLSPPTSVVAGDAMDPAVQVEVRDVGGTRVADAGTAITLALGANPGSGTLSGTKTVNAVNGVASFSGLWIEKAGIGYTMVASATGISSVISTGFDVLADAAVSIGYLPPPVSPTAGEPLGAGVAIKDAYGNTVTSAGGDVTIVLDDGPGPLVGTTTETLVDGVAVFDAVSIEVAGEGYVLRAGSSGFASIESAAFEVVAAAPHHLGWGNSAFLPTGDANLPVTEFEVGVRDIFGNLVDHSTAPVTLTFEGGDHPGAAADGDLTVNAFDGIANFTDVSVDRPGRYDFNASSPGLADTTRTVASLLRPGPTYLVMSAGADHSCVTSRGGAFCWGSNSGGQLGGATGLPLGDSVAVSADVDALFDWVSAGTVHSCGITDASVAYCWGQNDEGQLGSGAGFDEPIPVPIAGNLSMAAVDAGDRHSCGVTTGGAAYCWGANDQGQLGTGAPGAGADTPLPVTGAIDFFVVVTGDEHSCGWAADSLAYCWGDNSAGQLGNDDAGQDSASPVPVSGGHKFVDLRSGARHVCGIASGGDLFCWGANDAGQLGDGGNSDSGVPVYVKTVVPVVGFGYFGQVGAGRAHTCVVNGPGAGVSCWGDDTSGQLGGGATVPGSTLIQTLWIAAGGSHTCSYVDNLNGLLEPNAGDGLAEGYRCWGANANGQLGDGSTADSSSPRRVVQGW